MFSQNVINTNRKNKDRDSEGKLSEDKKKSFST